jgi:hypothetical protein
VGLKASGSVTEPGATSNTIFETHHCGASRKKSRSLAIPTTATQDGAAEPGDLFGAANGGPRRENPLAIRLSARVDMPVPSGASKKKPRHKRGFSHYYARRLIIDASIVAAPPIGAARGNRPLIKPAAVSIAIEPRRIDVGAAEAIVMVVTPVIVVPIMIPVAIGLACTTRFVITLGDCAAVDTVTRRQGTIVMNSASGRDMGARD